MLLKGRTESEELLIYRYLNIRDVLTKKEKNYYLNLDKGYQGEVVFDQLTKNMVEERYIINDLLLEVNNSHFQIDTSIISQGVIHLIDIKNFDGKYYFKSGILYSESDRECKNPIDQLNRSASLFRQLLQNLKLHYHVESFVVFINPDFTLYQAPMDLPIILPNQVNRFLKKLNESPSKLNDGHKKLAHQLISLHKTKNPFAVLPNYTYDKIPKGSCCKRCHSFLISRTRNYLVCGTCGEVERIEEAIFRHTNECKLLFSERRITTQSINEWCQLDLNRKTYYRALKKHFTAIGNTKNTYYE